VLSFPIGAWGWAHLVLFGVLLPLAAIRGARRVIGGLVRPRLLQFRTICLMQAVLLLFSLRVAGRESIPLFPPHLPPPLSLGLGLLLLGAAYLAAAPHWRDAVVRREPRVHFVMPRTPAERGMWVVLSLVGGIADEVAYRGVVFALLLRLSADPLSAALGAAGLFGASQAAQGWRAMGVISVAGLACQGLVLLSGSLYVAILFHVSFNLLAGFSYARFGEETGFPADGLLAPIPPDATITDGA